MSLLFFPLPFRIIPAVNDDDIFDRLHHRWTVTLLTCFGFLTGLSSFFGDPIHCWCPTQFTDTHCNYTESYCWISNTYFIPQEEPIPVEIDQREEKKIKYYQWVPMILFFLALCYKVPNLIWKMLNKKSGLNIHKIVHSYDESQCSEDQDENVKNVTHVFTRWLEVSSLKPAGLVDKSFSRFRFGKRMRFYLTMSYLCTKVCYIAVSVSMMFILNKFLAMEYTFFGVELIANLFNKTEKAATPSFPREMLCDFNIRQLQNLQRYTVQCYLSINLFNEKIFAFLWFWFLVMALVGTGSLIVWIKRILIPSQRIDFVNKYVAYISNDSSNNETTNRKSVEASMETIPDQPEEEKPYLDDGTSNKTSDVKRRAQEKFCRDFLAMDGVFALKLIEYNTSEMLVYDLVKNLWNEWGVLR